mmetsp:Transcript_847/g.1884  ORF Transcript_847/g.1884 Transcript_847/m.1884 type:complete len:171 (-) Transcript_847:1579-2091(-)
MSSQLAHRVRERDNSKKDDESRAKKTKFIKDQLDKMSEEQITRFEFFMRSHLAKQQVKETMAPLVPQYNTPKDIPDEISICVASLTKLFIGELIEESTQVLKEENNGPTGLKTEYIKEGFRRMCRDGKVDTGTENVSLFGTGGALYNSGDYDVVGDNIDLTRSDKEDNDI